MIRMGAKKWSDVGRFLKMDKPDCDDFCNNRLKARNLFVLRF